MDIKKIFTQLPFRRKLLLLFLVIFLPALGIIVASGISQRQHALVKAQDDAMLLVRSLVAQQEQIAIATKTMLSTLARMPEVQNLEAPACNRIFAELHHLYPFYASILAITPDGYVFAAHAPLEPGKVNQSDRKYFQDAISSFDFSAGEYIIGRVSKTTSFNYSFPVLDANKKLVAVLTAGLNLHKFDQFISMAHLPQGSAVVFLDHQGLRLFRSPENEATPIGKRALKSYFDAVSGSVAEGLFEWTALDGVKRINAFKQLRLRENSPPYMYIVVGLPKDMILHKANLNMLRSLLILGLAALLSLSLAWLLANVVLIRPINLLVAATQQFGQGDMDTRTGLPHTSDELGRLAQSFDDMALLLETRNIERERAEEALNKAYVELDERVQERTAALSAANATLLEEISERKRVEEHLRSEQIFSERLIHSLPAIVYLFDDQGRFLRWNNNLEKVSGYSAEEIASMQPLEFFEGEDRRHIEEATRETFLTGESTVEGVMITKDGRRIPHFFIASRIELDGKLRLLGVGTDITERKQAEEALSKNYRELQETAHRLDQSMNMLQLIIESIPVRVFWKDYDLRYLGCNTLFARDAGFDQPQQLLGKDDFAMAWIDRADLYRADDRQVMDSCRPKLNIIAPLTTPTGATIWLNTSKVPLQKTNGEVFGVLGVYEDITERIEAEDALRQERDFVTALLQTLGTLVIVMDRAGKVVRFNHACEQASGYTFEEVKGKPIFELLLLPEEAEEVKKVFQSLTSGEFPSVNENHWVARDGERRLFSWSNTVLKDDQGRVLYVIGTGNDITERWQAEKALRESEARYRLLIDNASDGIIMADVDGNILDANRKIEELLDYSKAELLCMNITQIHQEEDLPKLMAEFQEGVRSGSNISTTLILRKDKTKVPVEINGRRFEFGGKTVMQGIFRDISERQKSEEERLKFSKLESMSILAGGIAHDFNNILTTILANIGLAMLDGKLSKRGQKRLEDAEQACMQAEKLSGQLLTFAKGGAPIKKVISLAKLLRESYKLALAGSKSRCEFSIPEDLWLVEADEGQIDQVINNLLINADQAMPSGGTIKIAAENIVVEEGSDLPLAEGKYVKLTLIDQGIGIPSQYLDKIFDPYFTTKHKGSGLGLATAYSIIIKHSGYMKVESQVGAGTIFHIYLPAKEGEPIAALAEQTTLTIGQGKVLVMDDDDKVREVLCRMLGRLGYEADSASDGAEALEKFVEAKESGRPFAAVILDLTVPGGMGGKETMEKLLRIDLQVKAIVSSGYSDDPIMANFKEYGFSEVIAKPYRVVELSKVLREVITKPPNKR